MEESCVRNSVFLFSFARLAVHLRILSHTGPQKSTIVSQRNFPYSPNGFSICQNFFFSFLPPLCLPYIPAPPILSPIASGAQPGFSHGAFPPIPAFRAMRAKPCVVRFDSVRFGSIRFGSVPFFSVLFGSVGNPEKFFWNPPVLPTFPKLFHLLFSHPQKPALRLLLPSAPALPGVLPGALTGLPDPLLCPRRRPAAASVRFGSVPFFSVLFGSFGNPEFFTGFEG